MVRMRLADVQCKRLVFRPGDRVLVRSHHRLDPQQRRQLQKAIQKWTGDQVEVLIIDLIDMDIEIQKAKQTAGGLIVNG